MGPTIQVRYGGKGGKPYALKLSPDMMVLRTRDRNQPTEVLRSKAATRAFEKHETVVQFPHAGVEVFRLPRQVLERSRRTLKREATLQFAGRVLADASGEPVVYTENFFVKFDDDIAARKAQSLLRDYGLSVKRDLPYAGHAYFAAAAEGTGRRIFDLAERLLAEEGVELCHPELIRRAERRAPHPNQWHLMPATVNGIAVDAHARVQDAWALSEGVGVVVAVIDDGMDTDHEEFAGSGKVVSPRDVTRKVDDARPYWPNDNHGTACAGVAVANGAHGASGVAPKARLMPIRLSSDLGSQAEADAFVWAAEHGADVISCSWGPTDGDPRNPNDPRHNQVVALPDSTRLAIDYAIQQGRGGKGCVITFAAGNGNEPVDNDGYASYAKVIAVAACNDRSKRSYYSDTGKALWCSFPSNDFLLNTPLTPGIWTTDRTGAAGYDPANYTGAFGGTSSACPGAAGVAALVLARNPDLRWDQVKEILKQCCDRIDAAGGAYDGTGHSKRYGYGRLNAKRAVELAAPSAAKRVVRHTTYQVVAIRDNAKSVINVAVGDTGVAGAVRVLVDLDHTYIGDLVVKVVPPAGAAVALHDRAGGSTKNLKRTYDAASTPGLAALAGKAPTGTWRLEVEDKAAQDTGQINSFGLEFDL